MVVRRGFLLAASATLAHPAWAGYAGCNRHRNQTSAIPHLIVGPPRLTASVAKTEAALFKMVNDQGGVGGRQINYVSLDDGYSPPRDGGSRCGGWWSRKKWRSCSPRSARQIEYRDLPLRTNGQVACRCCFVGGAGRQANGADYQSNALGHGLAAQLPDRSADLHHP